MAQPPIIISNGGMASALTEGLVPKNNPNGDPADVIMANVRKLNQKAREDASDRPVAGMLKAGKDAKVLWRLANEKDRYKNDEDREL